MNPSPTIEPVYGIPPDLVIGEARENIALAGEINWGMEVFTGLTKLRAVTRGEGVIIAGLDTGVDRTHPLMGNCVESEDFTNSASGPEDRNGHGTHISGTIAATDPRIGVAHGCRYIHGKVLGDNGSGSGRGIAAGIRWAANRGAEIISMSLGSSSRDDQIINAMQEVAAAGVWVFAAAGNSGGGTSEIDWPGRSEHCISVAALNRDLTPASFSSSGAKIDTSGPGVKIISCRPGGGFVEMSGTSMATPYVAGVAGVFRSGLKMRGKRIPTIYEFRDEVFARSTDTHTPGDDRRTGPGWITPELFLLALTDDPPPIGG